ncbi:MAG: hypothetical protein AB1430_18590 [Pseudomonadota bacterium]
MSGKPLPIRDAMDQSAPLAQLFRRLQESNARFATVRAQLPAALQAQVKPGPVDEQGWTLIAPHAAAAAKLRHLAPLLQQALAREGWPALAIRVKIGGSR